MASMPVDASRSKALIVLALVFLGGGASGVLSSLVFDRATVSPQVTKKPVTLSETKLVELTYLRDELLLNSTQVQQVREILDQCIMNEADLLMQIRANQDSGRERILEILTPKQRTKFQSGLPEALSGKKTPLGQLHH